MSLNESSGMSEANTPHLSWGAGKKRQGQGEDHEDRPFSKAFDTEFSPPAPSSASPHCEFLFPPAPSSASRHENRTFLNAFDTEFSPSAPSSASPHHEFLYSTAASSDNVSSTMSSHRPPLHTTIGSSSPASKKKHKSNVTPRRRNGRLQDMFRSIQDVLTSYKVLF